MKKKEKKVTKSSLFLKMPSCIGSLFIDSGAHGLHNKHIHSQKVTGYNLKPGAQRDVVYDPYYTSKEFFQYVDDYAAYIKRYPKSIDFYVNVDVIQHPEYSHKVLEILENKHGLKPLPVVHYPTDTSWVERYIKSGYDFIGIGGLGQDVTKWDYMRWADSVFDLICDTSDRKPCVKTHGFAMTSWFLMRRYPWWSVDSASWLKAGAFGQIYVPRKKKGVFDFNAKPFSISISSKSPNSTASGKHFLTLSSNERNLVREWLEEISIPMGVVDENGDLVEWGVLSDWEARCKANLLFFEAFREHLPDWPWPFKSNRRRTLFE